MIITRTPYRISFLGGGTDFPEWFEGNENGGQVLSSTIDKYCYISCRILPPFFEHKHRIVYSRIEDVKSVEEIRHPSARAVLNWMDVQDGLEIHHDGDLPARSGLGSSSAFTVGLLHALYAQIGRLITKDSLATQAIEIERNILCENVGFQDQVAVAYGGLNHIVFNQRTPFEVRQLPLSETRISQLNDHMLLFFTGISRISSEVAASTIENIPQNNAALTRMLDMVDVGIKMLTDPSISLLEFGALIDESWQVKRCLSSKISNTFIDELYFKAIKAGAVGGKILGAGGGGFLLIFADPNFHPVIKEELVNLVNVPFKFENNGSQLVLYQPNGL